MYPHGRHGSDQGSIRVGKIRQLIAVDYWGSGNLHRAAPIERKRRRYALAPQGSGDTDRPAVTVRNPSPAFIHKNFGTPGGGA